MIVAGFSKNLTTSFRLLWICLVLVLPLLEYHTVKHHRSGPTVFEWLEKLIERYRLYKFINVPWFLPFRWQRRILTRLRRLKLSPMNRCRYYQLMKFVNHFHYLKYNVNI